MQHASDHAFSQTPFEPVDRYRGCTLLGRYVPEAKDGRSREYHIEVHADGKVRFWAAVHAPHRSFQDASVGAAEERLQKAALDFARELIDADAAPREDFYRRALQETEIQGKGENAEEKSE